VVYAAKHIQGIHIIEYSETKKTKQCSRGLNHMAK